MSRRTEIAYKAQSPGKSAQHDKAQDSGDREMLRLCSDGSRSYPGRYGSHAVKHTVANPGPDLPGNQGPGITGCCRR